jgi:excisionase family DNA binding protein
MAKAFYTIEEALEQLSVGEEELKALVRDGQLREFRDGGQVKYKSAEVDDLASNMGALGGSSLSGSTGELILEPSDESSMGLTGSDMLTLDEADREDEPEGTSIIGDKGEDTVITSVGISVFDDEDVPEADPAANTVLDEQKSSIDLSLSSTGSGIGLSSTGTGSGLLDLTREADDTSLGAELLDEIYSEDQEAGIPEPEEDAESSDLGASAGGTADDSALEDEEPVTAPAVATVSAAAVSAGGGFESGLTGATLGAILTLCVAGVAITSNMQGVFPDLLNKAYLDLPIAGGIFAGVTAVFFFVGFMVGRRG